MGFFMGMPFPLGILALRAQPPGVIAWAWGTNGYFTVLGGVASGVLSLFVGFRWTFLFGLVLYLAAWLVITSYSIHYTKLYDVSTW